MTGKWGEIDNPVHKQSLPISKYIHAAYNLVNS